MGTDLREECFSHICLAQKLVLQKAYIYWRAHRKEETNVVYKEVLYFSRYNVQQLHSQE
jgi:hypothetical protein